MSFKRFSETVSVPVSIRIFGARDLPILGMFKVVAAGDCRLFMQLPVTICKTLVLYGSTIIGRSDS